MLKEKFDLIALKNDDNVIATSPLLKLDGLRPVRYVVRDMGSEYVCHTEYLNYDEDIWYIFDRLSIKGKSSFDNGAYYPKLDDAPFALLQAFQTMTQRFQSHVMRLI